MSLDGGKLHAFTFLNKTYLFFLKKMLWKREMRAKEEGGNAAVK